MKPYLIEIAFFSLFLVVTILRAALLAVRRRRANGIDGVDSHELVFHERSVSAFSDNALLGGLDSHKSLELVLTRAELWLRDSEPADGGEQRLCNIVLSNIRSIRRQGKFIKIDFLSQCGRSGALLLRLKDHREFLEQLNALVLPGPSLRLPLRWLRRNSQPKRSVEP